MESQPTPSIEIQLQANYAFRQDKFLVIAKVTGPATPYDEVWISVFESGGNIVAGSLRRQKWKAVAGTQTFEWREKWFERLETGRSYKFMVALAAKRSSEYQVASEDVQLQRLGPN